MSVEFEEEAMPMRAPVARKLSLFTRIAIKLQLAKDEEGAQRVMLIAALLCLAAALILFLNLAGIF